MAAENEQVGAAASGPGRTAGDGADGLAGAAGNVISDMVAQMRQLAEEHPEAARRLAADLTAALGRAGMVFDGEKITEHVSAAAARAGEPGVASEVVAGQEH